MECEQYKTLVCVKQGHEIGTEFLHIGTVEDGTVPSTHYLVITLETVKSHCIVHFRL